MLTTTEQTYFTSTSRDIQAREIGELLGVSPENTLVLKLAERRISPAVVATYQLQPHGTGWTYPTPAGALRFKNADSAAPNKYAWLGEGRDTLLFPNELREAIEATGGDAWLTTEFDFFAMQSAGIYHTVAQLQGESSVPADLAPLLQSLGVLTCHVAPDRDTAGQAWAQKVADALNPAGIEVIAHELPYELTEKHGGDLGKLWQGYTRKQPFERYLFTLPAAVVKAKYAPAGEDVALPTYIPVDIKEQVAHVLAVHKYNAKGYSTRIPCPFHDDQKPSAALHREMGLHCFVCGWHRWKDLAEVLGLVWKPATAAESGKGLGDELLQAMIARGASTLASVLETAYRAGWVVGRTFTIGDVTGLGVPYWRARKAFMQMDGKGFDLRKQNSRGRKGKRVEAICWELTHSFSITTEGLILNKKVGHRPAKAKRLPAPAEVAAAFGVKVTKHTTLTHKPNLADFRAEVYALPVVRDPGSYPRQELCKPLAISTTTARAYDRRAGLTVTKHQERAPITSADGLPDTPELKATWLEVGEGGSKRNFPATTYGFDRAKDYAAQIGGKVAKVRQLANEYKKG